MKGSTPVSLLRHLAQSLFGVLVIVMAYGFFHFPAAPFHYVNEHYADKLGRSHSREKFEDLRGWERILIASWVASAGSAIAHQVVKRSTDKH